MESWTNNRFLLFKILFGNLIEMTIIPSLLTLYQNNIDSSLPKLMALYFFCSVYVNLNCKLNIDLSLFSSVETTVVYFLFKYFAQ